MQAAAVLTRARCCSVRKCCAYTRGVNASHRFSAIVRMPRLPSAARFHAAFVRTQLAKHVFQIINRHKRHGVHGELQVSPHQAGALCEHAREGCGVYRGSCKGCRAGGVHTAAHTRVAHLPNMHDALHSYNCRLVRARTVLWCPQRIQRPARRRQSRRCKMRFSTCGTVGIGRAHTCTHTHAKAYGRRLGCRVVSSW